MQTRVRHRAQSCISLDRQAARAALRAELERKESLPVEAVDDAAILMETARLERKTLERGFALCARIRNSLNAIRKD